MDTSNQTSLDPPKETDVEEEEENPAMEDFECHVYDHMFNLTPKHRLRLPHTTTTTDGEELEVAYATSEQTVTAYEWLQQEAQNGGNLGRDEIESQKFFEMLLRVGQMLSLTDTKNNHIKGFVIVFPNLYSRSRAPCVGKLKCIFPKFSAISDNLEYLLLAGEQAARGLGYEGVVIDVFLHLTEYIEILDANGYVSVGCIPRSGLSNPKGRWRGNMIMYKDFTLYTSNNIKIPLATNASDSQVQEPDWDTIISKLDGEKQELLDEMTNKLTYLPCEYSTKKSGQLKIRIGTEKDVTHMYKYMQHYAQENTGFGVDELAEEKVFTAIIATEGLVVVAESGETREWMMTFVICPTDELRTSEITLADAFAVANPAHRGKGLGHVYHHWIARICKDLGYHGLLTSTNRNNTAQLHLLDKFNYIVVATIPKCVRMKSGKWEASFTAYRDLSGGVDLENTE